MIIRLAAFALIICLLALLFFANTKEEKIKWQLTDISGHLPDLKFSLIDDNGKAVTAADYKNNVVLLYFGFTGCSAECPLTMARLSTILKRLGKDADHIHVLFVTVNPENDTPEILHHYLAAYDAKHISGLTGKAGEIEALAKRYRAAYRAESGNAADFPHSNVIYIFDKSGHAKLLAAPNDADEKIISDLRHLS